MRYTDTIYKLDVFMDLKEHTKPENLEKYSFLWSEARLLIAAVALFLGGFPPALKIAPYSLYSPVSSILTVCWVISGVASLYLGYRWYKGGKKVFGGTDQKDTIAFFIMVVTGFNLGFAGLFGTNIGMTISSNLIVFYVVGVLYILTAVYLFKRWKTSGRRVF
jgi:drug/metabolite transporter (DMT)-like permease